MKKSTFITIEFNSTLTLEAITEIEKIINKETNKHNISAVVSNLQYKKGAYFQ